MAETPDDQIELQWRSLMKELADIIGATFNEPGVPHTMGFMLAVFPLGSIDGRFNYISNAKREDMIILMTEMLAKFKGQPDVVGHG